MLSSWGLGGQAHAQSCSITLKPTVSGCYQNSGSKATVSVEVTWSNATVSPTANDPSDAMTVTYAGQTRTIDPGAYSSVGGNGTIVSPQVVAFEVNLATTVSGLTVSAAFSANNGCSAVSAGVPLPAACPPTACGGNNLGGMVFNDFNADGVKDSGETSGVPGVVVNAYDRTGALVGTATTDVFGLYSISSLQAGSYPLRVEFTALPTYAGQGTRNGSNGRTSIQFANTPSCNVDFGILYPNDYCQANPQILVPCYLNGDPNHPGSSNEAAIVSMPYGLSGKTAVAKIPDVGSVWAIAFDRYTDVIYSASFLRRHAGLKAGLGAIFKTDITTNTTTQLVDLATLPGVNLGTAPSNATRGLGAFTEPSNDNYGWNNVGKVGLGGMDLSTDGKKLYVINLTEKKLHRLDVNNPTSAPGVLIPNPSCLGGDARPFALKLYKDKAYVGLVCDASNGNKSHLRAYVYQYDLNDNTFDNTPVFDFPLTHPKGFPWIGTPEITGWYPWTDNWAVAAAITNPAQLLLPDDYGDIVIHPEPIFSDIEFDVDGSMILGFADRFGLQTGHRNYGPAGEISATGKGFSNLAGGDILRAFFNGTSYVLENNANVGPIAGNGPGNNQGPGFGEFYDDNFLAGGGLVHAENSNGGLAIRPGSGETVYSAMDPENDVGNSGGIRKVDNLTGNFTAAFRVYSGNIFNGLFAKAAGIGDVELTCGTPTFLEIGNRVWIDSDKDGIQDPNEGALPNVKVALFRGNTLVATTTTSASGEYYFNTTNAPTMLPNTTYSVRFGTDGASDQFDSNTDVLTVNGERYNATIAFSTAATANVFNDSNAQKSGGYLSASVTTGAAGSVNHSIDAGFHIACPLINCYPTLVSKN
ncbi:SdrD B-like domain-containing protein [Spirosoma fluviale]|uniref:SdrD B-like domain-containing protein n=1 Tax=Spirosoma fluviale TaxID=1597977 RepID=UPI0015CDA899|nr:SdrD B-like domain-containing protein [Spirosoma fluviale]